MVTQRYRWDFIGLSTDTKPTKATSDKVANGSTYYESDTSKLYVFYGDQWYEKTATGGGGTTYTAGDGIDITSNKISVDTDTIQEKLTAGTNITIDSDNVISATGGGSSVNVVQTTGTSETDVMSQKAVTSMVFDNGSTSNIKIGYDTTLYQANKGIVIGSQASARSAGVAIGSRADAYSDAVAVGAGALASHSSSVCIGESAKDSNSSYAVSIGRFANVGNNHNGSVALGAESSCSRAGEVNIGSTSASYGYNSTNYRVLGGVHDGQLAQDAVTVAQVNATIDAINTALSTNIPHIGATS